MYHPNTHQPTKKTSSQSHLNSRKTTFKLSSLILLLALTILTAHFRPKHAQTATKPNILWITSEDNGPFIGCYGDSNANTPNINGLATATATDGTKEGVYFLNAIANAPVCAPSRCSLITGMTANTLGTEQMRSQYALPSFVELFPKYLKDSGYYTYNNSKTDYNIKDESAYVSRAWTASSSSAHYYNRPDKTKPFFQVYNLSQTHESNIQNITTGNMLNKSFPFHPNSEMFRKTWAQYYDKINQMDQSVGTYISRLKSEGEWDNTIVIYYSDHGGALPGMKRFVQEDGTRVPFVARIPKQFHNLLPDDLKNNLGASADRLICFVDLAPTILNLAGLSIPSYMQGKAFMGATTQLNDYIYQFRGRMDERYDCSRAARNKQYKYIRNYNPFLIYLQHVDYQFQCPSTRSWEEEYQNGNCNSKQAAFFGTKPYEELYDLGADSHGTNNLAANPSYAATLNQFRTAFDNWQNTYRDAGLVPEADLIDRTASTTSYDLVNGTGFPYARVKETAELAAKGDQANLATLKARLAASEDNVVRYWAAVGCFILRNSIMNDTAAADSLKNCLTGSDALKIAAAKTLIAINKYVPDAETALTSALNDSNNKTVLQALNALQEPAPVSANLLTTARQVKNNNTEDYVQRAVGYLLESHQTPYPGPNPPSLPGTIEAENYDRGGEEIGYHDTTSGNTGGQYRTEDVDIQPVTGGETGGYNIGWTVAGEWLEYSGKVVPGTYDIQLRVATASTGKRLELSFDGTVLSTVTVPNTGGWQTWQTVTITGKTLSGGFKKQIRVKWLDGSVNLNWIKLTNVTPKTLREAELGLFKGDAEFYTDTALPSGKGVNYLGRTIGNGIVFNNVPATSSLTISYANGAGMSRTMSLYVNHTHRMDISFPATSGWSGAGAYANKVVSVTLANNDLVELVRDSTTESGINVDYIDFR